ncbi:hypothetical protein I8751_25270 [Nostocaceae cyanobacterium CENA357]|uniref:Uncharacterized protein n=1 Tax=Atlanticothrix silvestris CENA357 TaxID=1725252 RepID=A0A8J7L521_9CYAN|nr:hypothetical protein [Atlanticothrix silvestris CENA357]
MAFKRSTTQHKFRQLNMDIGVGFPYVKRHLLQVGRAAQRSGSPTYNFFAIFYCNI